MRLIWGYIFIILLALSSCEFNKEIDIEIPTTYAKLSVIAYLGEGNAASIFISPSIGLFDSVSTFELQDIRGYVFEENLLLCELQRLDKPQYFAIPSNIELVSGRNYYLTASTSIYPEITTKVSTIPTKINIENIELLDTTDNYLELAISFEDVGLQENYYTTKVESYFQGNLLVDSFFTAPVIDPASIFSDLSFNGNKHEIFLKTSTYNTFMGGHVKVDEVRVVLFSLSKELYLFFNSINQLEATFSDPTLESSPIFSNIENGYGVFGGYASDTIVLNL